jgi:hypothetical protein
MPGQLTKPVVRSLADATAHWLAYKKACGFENVFSEALLIIPIAECLASKGYSIKTESHTADLGIGDPGDFNYDAVATNEQEQATIFIETKYLVGNANASRLYGDLVKLALPSEARCPTGKFSRLLLVAGTGLDNSSVINNMRSNSKMTIGVPEKGAFNLSEEIKGNKALVYFVNKLAFGDGRDVKSFNVSSLVPTKEADGEQLYIFSVTR